MREEARWREPWRCAGVPVLEPATARVMAAWRMQLAEAHTGCHHAGVVRRDIKPDEEGARGRGGGRDEEGARDGVGVGRR